MKMRWWVKPIAGGVAWIFWINQAVPVCAASAYLRAQAISQSKEVWGGLQAELLWEPGGRGAALLGRDNLAALGKRRVDRAQAQGRVFVVGKPPETALGAYVAHFQALYQEPLPDDERAWLEKALRATEALQDALPPGMQLALVHDDAELPRMLADGAVGWPAHRQLIAYGATQQPKRIYLDLALVYGLLDQAPREVLTDLLRNAADGVAAGEYQDFPTDAQQRLNEQIARIKAGLDTPGRQARRAELLDKRKAAARRAAASLKAERPASSAAPRSVAGEAPTVAQHKQTIEQELLQRAAGADPDLVRVQIDAGIATVTINRPGALNALNTDVLARLYQTITALSQDETVRAIIFTGAGRAFVAGADIQSLYDQRQTGEEVSLAGQLVLRLIEHVGKPVIAAVNGFALGGGEELALSAHYRIASPNAVFGQPEITLGILPGYGGTQRLARLVGRRAAALISLSGEQISARRAEIYGLVDEVAPDAVARAREIARSLADRASSVEEESLLVQRWRRVNQFVKTPEAQSVGEDPVVQRLVKEHQARGQGEAARRIVRAIDAAVWLGPEAGEDAEAALFGEVMRTPEAEQGLGDFLNRRQHKPLALPALWPIDQWRDLPETREAWIVRQGGPVGPASVALERATLPLPDIRDDEVLIEVLASPAEANAGRWLPQRKPVDLLQAHGQPFHVPGNIAVGRIVARGGLVPELPHVALGSLVVTHNASTATPYDARMLRGDADMPLVVRGYDEFQADPAAPQRSGAYASYVTAKFSEVMPKPESLTFEEAATYPLADPTIWHNFRRTRLGRADTLLLVGAAGSTGLRAIEIAKSMGARRVIGLVSTEKKKEAIERLSAPEQGFEVVGLLRTEFNLTDPADVERFVERVKALNSGALADVALDFFGADYPNAFLRAVKAGHAADGIRGVGRFSWYGAELDPIAKISGVPGHASVEAMFRAIEEVRDLPGTDASLAAAVALLGDTPETRAAVEAARASTHRDRAIQRVLTYGADDHTMEVLRSSVLRKAKVAVAVKNAEEAARLRARLAEEPALQPAISERGIIDLASLVSDGKLDERRFLAAVRQGQALGDRPDVIVERNDPDAAPFDTVNLSYFRLLRPGGQVIFTEDTSGRTFTIDMRGWVTQRDLLFPTRFMISSHYASQTESWQANEAIRTGKLGVTHPTILPFDRIPQGLDSQGDGKIVFLHGIRPGLRTAEDAQAGYAVSLPHPAPWAYDSLAQGERPPITALVNRIVADYPYAWVQDHRDELEWLLARVYLRLGSRLEAQGYLTNQFGVERRDAEAYLNDAPVLAESAAGGLGRGGRVIGEISSEDRFDDEQPRIDPSVEPIAARQDARDTAFELSRTVKEVERQAAQADVGPAVEELEVAPGTRQGIEFGTAGWRGPFRGVFTLDRVRLLVQAAADYLNANQPVYQAQGMTDADGRPVVVVGYDFRQQGVSDAGEPLSERAYAQEAARILAGNGLAVKLLSDVGATPLNVFAMHHLHAAAMFNFTASHNPAADGGIEIFSGLSGGLANNDMTDPIVGALRRDPAADATAIRVVRRSALDDPLLDIVGVPIEPYVDYVKQALGVDPDLISRSGLQVVIDPQFGAGMRVREVIQVLGLSVGKPGESGVQVAFQNDTPDPHFGGKRNAEVTRENLEPLQETVRNTGADLGIGYDGDADRTSAVTGSAYFNGNDVAALLVYASLKQAKDAAQAAGTPWRPEQYVIVRSIVSSGWVDAIAKGFGVPDENLRKTAVGFRFLNDAIRKAKAEGKTVIVAFEENGGLAVGEAIPYKDGFATSLRFLTLAANAKLQGQTVDQLFAEAWHHAPRPTYVRTDVEMRIPDRTVSDAYKGGKGRVMQEFFRIGRAIEARRDLRQESWLQLRPDAYVQALDGNFMDGVYLKVRDGQDQSWIDIRASGTEPIFRIYVEAPTNEANQALTGWAKAILSRLERQANQAAHGDQPPALLRAIGNVVEAAPAEPSGDLETQLGGLASRLGVDAARLRQAFLASLNTRLLLDDLKEAADPSVTGVEAQLTQEGLWIPSFGQIADLNAWVAALAQRIGAASQRVNWIVLNAIQPQEAIRQLVALTSQDDVTLLKAMLEGGILPSVTSRYLLWRVAAHELETEWAIPVAASDLLSAEALRYAHDTLEITASFPDGGHAREAVRFMNQGKLMVDADEWAALRYRFRVVRAESAGRSFNYRGGVRDYFEQTFVPEVIPGLDEHVRRHFTAAGKTLRYVASSGIGANEEYTRQLAALHNQTDPAVRWLVVNNPAEWLQVRPADASAGNTLFVDISRSGNTEETLKTFEFTAKAFPVRVVLANKGPLYALANSRNQAADAAGGDRPIHVQSMPADIGGRLMRRKTPMVYVPMYLAEGRQALETYVNATEAFDRALAFEQPASLAVSVAAFLLANLLLGRRSQLAVFGMGATQDSPLIRSVEELQQLWMEGAQKQASPLAPMQALVLPHHSHKSLEGVLGHRDDYVGMFVLERQTLGAQGSVGLQPSDVSNPLHAGLTTNATLYALAAANAQRTAELVPTIRVEVEQADPVTAAALASLYEDLSVYYTALTGQDPNSNPEVKGVRDLGAEHLARAAAAATPIAAPAPPAQSGPSASSLEERARASRPQVELLGIKADQQSSLKQGRWAGAFGRSMDQPVSPQVASSAAGDKPIWLVIHSSVYTATPDGAMAQERLMAKLRSLFGHNSSQVQFALVVEGASTPEQARTKARALFTAMPAASQHTVDLTEEDFALILPEGGVEAAVLSDGAIGIVGPIEWAQRLKANAVSAGFDSVFVFPVTPSEDEHRVTPAAGSILAAVETVAAGRLDPGLASTFGSFEKADDGLLIPKQLDLASDVEADMKTYRETMGDV